MLRFACFALLFVCALQCAYAGTFLWTSCGTAADKFQVEDVIMIPDPPVKGQNLSIIASGQMSMYSVEEVTGGTFHIVTKYGIITVFETTQPVCEAPVTCPIPAGPFNSTLPPQTVPRISPDGKYNGNVKIDDQNNEEIACVNFSFVL